MAAFAAVGIARLPATVEPPRGWKWVALSELAKMATGHTPSRDEPGYWGGTIKWMCAGDARFRHGGVVRETQEKITQEGIDNSAAVMLPADTVCLARTGASIGYAVRLGEPMATNQGFVNWICGNGLLPKFLQYILVAEINFLERIAYGAAHHTIYFPELKAFHVCIPPVYEQQRIVGILDEAFAGIATAKANAEKNLTNARELFESELQAVFTRGGDGWGEKRLGDIAEFKNGLNFSQSSRGQSVRVVGVGDFHENYDVPIKASSFAVCPSIHLLRNSATYRLATMPYSRDPARFAAAS